MKTLAYPFGWIAVLALLQSFAPLLHAHVGGLALAGKGIHLHPTTLRAAADAGKALRAAHTPADAAAIGVGEWHKGDRLATCDCQPSHLGPPAVLTVLAGYCPLLALADTGARFPPKALVRPPSQAPPADLA